VAERPAILVGEARFESERIVGRRKRVGLDAGEPVARIGGGGVEGAGDVSSWGDVDLFVQCAGVAPGSPSWSSTSAPAREVIVSSRKR
jgi:hypothetical protein